MSVVIETTLGDFTVDLFTDERPQTCRNFLKLCKIKYYNWHLFHTVQSHFIAQTGDPTGTGKAGESIYGTILGEKARYYEGERMPKIKHDRVGLLSMVNCGDYMFGSQFIITLDKDLQSLDGEHCVFGEIVEGIDIILKFNEAICDGDHRPFQDIRISHTVILEDPFEDPENLPIPDKSPEPTKEFLLSDRIGADEILDDEAGLSMEEIIEMRKDKEAKAAATILEIVGDIPDADIAPPENVLFVCKLNPVTTDDDLEIIFSRFGRIVGCEVIRDRQTGDSLQYAFIEFAEQKSCEEAYLKMDNTLIDDRRIHVDFSQSVAKMRWRGKGKGFLYNDDKRANPNSERESSKKKRDTGDRRRRPQQHYNRDNDYDRDRRDDDQRKRSKRYDREGVDDDYDRDGEGRRRNRSQEEEYTSRHHYRDRKYNEKSRKEDRENDDNYNKDEEVKNRKKLRTGENKDRHRHHSREEREKSRKDDSGEEQNYSKDEERRHRRKIREEESTSRRRQDNDHERKDRERNRREAPGKDDDYNRDEAVRGRERLREEEKKNRHHHENRRDRESRRERSRDRSNRRQYNESSKDKHKDKYTRERTPDKKHRDKSSKRTYRD